MIWRNGKAGFLGVFLSGLCWSWWANEEQMTRMTISLLNDEQVSHKVGVVSTNHLLKGVLFPPR